MSNSDHFVTASEYFEAIKAAFVRAYLNDDFNELDTRKWHPDDLTINLSVVIESIGAYSNKILYDRALERISQRHNPKRRDR